SALTLPDRVESFALASVQTNSWPPESIGPSAASIPAIPSSGQSTPGAVVVSAAMADLKSSGLGVTTGAGVNGSLICPSTYWGGSSAVARRVLPGWGGAARAG